MNLDGLSPAIKAQTAATLRDIPVGQRLKALRAILIMASRLHKKRLGKPIK